MAWHTEADLGFIVMDELVQQDVQLQSRSQKRRSRKPAGRSEEDGDSPKMERLDAGTRTAGLEAKPDLRTRTPEEATIGQNKPPEQLYWG